jgi:hypothetical protein
MLFIWIMWKFSQATHIAVLWYHQPGCHPGCDVRQFWWRDSDAGWTWHDAFLMTRRDTDDSSRGATQLWCWPDVVVRRGMTQSRRGGWTWHDAFLMTRRDSDASSRGATQFWCWPDVVVGSGMTQSWWGGWTWYDTFLMTRRDSNAGLTWWPDVARRGTTQSAGGASHVSMTRLITCSHQQASFSSLQLNYIFFSSQATHLKMAEVESTASTILNQSIN